MIRLPRRPAALAAAAAVLLPALLLPAAPAAADSIRAQQWPLTTLGAHTAWRTSTGKGVTVAVLDTGVDSTHPDLTGNVLTGKDFIGFGAKPGQSAWARHGTAMAGIIAGHGHGPGDEDGVMGIAPDAKILPVRVILEDTDPKRKQARASRGGALAQGIRWAADHGADVINLSLGDDSRTAHPDAAEDDAVQYALHKGIVVVASAGNSGQHGNPVSYPAAYPGVIAVAAVDHAGDRAAFSTERWYADVGAPGVDVVIADPDTHYYEGWGTSAASAYVSGVVALIRAKYPKLTPAQVRSLLETTATDRPAGGRDDAIGSGVVDPVAALTAAATEKPAATPPAAYPHPYFGRGPTADATTGTAAATLPLWLAVAGALSAGAGAALWYNATRKRQPR
jgi:type VII secretion-associated serine protease mycosin